MVDRVTTAPIKDPSPPRPPSRNIHAMSAAGTAGIARACRLESSIMPLLQHLCQLLNDSSFGTVIRESDYAYSIIESVHVISITLLVGTIAVLDLRMLGLLLQPIAITRIARAVIPLAWSGFALMFLSGLLLFWAEAAKMYGNPAFRVKVILLALVGLNPLIFHTTVYRRVHEWEGLRSSPWRARIAAIFSLALWGGIIVAGRAIAYF